MIDDSDVRPSPNGVRQTLPVCTRFVGKVREFSQQLESTFEPRFLRFLLLTYLGLKGIVLTLIQSSMLPYFQAMNVDSNGYQLANVVAMIPWSMKGFVGVLSDVLPIGKYHKRGYLLLSAVIGTVGTVALAAISPQSLNAQYLWRVAVMFCAINTLLSTFDLLCEGKYSELMRENHAGSEILTFVWTCVMIGGLVGAIVVACIVDSAGAQPIIAICLPFVFLAVWRTCAGDLPELPARSWTTLRLKVRSEPGLFILAAAMATGSLLLALCTALLPDFRDIVSLLVSCGLVLLSFWALPRTLARCNLYLFIISVSYIDLSGPLAYFYTGSTSCVEDAPHFSYSYFIAITNIVGNAGGALGAMIFQGMQHWQFRSAFVFTACLQAVASLFDLVMINRWNTRIGISDEATFLFGDAACQSIASMMQLMPTALLTARLCPRGAEATVFAILAGFQNFGSAIASIFGVQLATALGIQASKEGPCNFDNLGIAVIISHCIAPVACLPLTWCLVPRARIDDDTAFQAVSPAPSFRSPPTSPGNSPRSSRTPSENDILEVSDVDGGDGDGAGEYFLMQEDCGGNMTRLRSE